MMETRSLRERSNTGARDIRVCEWQLSVMRISRVQRVARLRADASSSRTSRRSTPQSNDRRVKRCDAKTAVFPNRRSTDLQSACRKARRGSHDDRRLGFVLTMGPSPVSWEAGLDQRVNRTIRVRKDFDAAQRARGAWSRRERVRG